MFKKVSLRWRLTIFTSLLITVCCIGLSLMLSISAYRMADTIDAMTIQPAQTVGGVDTENSLMMVMPSHSAQTVNQAKHSYLAESLLYTAIAVLVGGVLTYYVSGKTLEPVRTLSAQVKNINAYNLDASLDVPPTKDELAELTASFNEMTDKLAQAFEMQKRFSADAAHELRTPLAVLQTKLDVFGKKKEHTPEEYEALTKIFQKQIRRLRNLVTELLDIANVEHELEKQEISMPMLLGDVVDGLSVHAEKKQVFVVLNCEEAQLLGDYHLLYRVFYNLIENAINYNVSGGNVQIELLKNKNQSVVINVKDTGIGIPDAFKKEIFEPFYRVDKSRSREMGGAGLGLSLVDTIIKKHHGTIIVTDNKNGGSCFTVELPTKE